MESLKRKILNEATVLSEKIIVVNSFLNHQIDSKMMDEIGDAFSELFKDMKATKILTAEASGIPPALATGMKLSIPIIYARKTKPLTMGNDVYKGIARSATTERTLEIMVQKAYLTSKDRVLIIDDFISEGYATKAMCDIVDQAGATLVGIGTVIEKTFLHGRKRFERPGVPIFSLVRIKSMDKDRIELE